jgi:uncharacterized protein
VLKDTGVKTLKSYGFDGNNESDLLGIARLLVDHMGRWSRFKDRDLNSHMPRRGTYERMLQAFEPMKEIHTHNPTAAEITTLLKAKTNR